MNHSLKKDEIPDFDGIKISESLYRPPKKRIKRKVPDSRKRPNMNWNNRRKFNQKASHANTNQTEG